jgi:hypothetical protein
MSPAGGKMPSFANTVLSRDMRRIPRRAQFDVVCFRADFQAQH